MALFRRLPIGYRGSILIAGGLFAAACSLDPSGLGGDVGPTTTGVGGNPTTTSTGMGAAGSGTTTTTSAGGNGGTGGGVGGSGGTGAGPGSGGAGGTGGIPGVGGAGGGSGGNGGNGGNGGAGGGIVCTLPIEGQFPLDNGVQVDITDGDTTMGGNNSSAMGCMGHGTAAQDVIYAVTPNGDGDVNLTFISMPSFTGVVYVRTDCDSLASEIMCGEGSSVNYEFPVAAGTTYYIIVDGNALEQGTFTLALKLTAP